VVKEKRYFAPTATTKQGGVPAEAQSYRDGGVAPKHKVPEDIAPQVASSRVFPGEKIN
jgi:hypothetical protein